MSQDDDEKSLLKPGQTVEEWWRANGTDMEFARASRAASYAEQRRVMLPKAKGLHPGCLT